MQMLKTNYSVKLCPFFLRRVRLHKIFLGMLFPSSNHKTFAIKIVLNGTKQNESQQKSSCWPSRRCEQPKMQVSYGRLSPNADFFFMLLNAI